MARCYLVSFCLLSIALSVTHARGEPPLLVRPTEFKNISGVDYAGLLESATRVKTAQILIADYELIKKDFPALATKSDAQIDRWLLAQTAYFTKEQAEVGHLTGIQTRISIDAGDTKYVLRPKDYGRAAVIKTDQGLIDVKGFGSKTPRLESHANGLAETAESLREYYFTKAVKKIFHDADAPFNVVDSYGVIDWGFEQFDYRTRNPYRSGAILRQAHVRNFEHAIAQGQVSNLITKQVENILRPYGMTSAVPRILNNFTVDALNVQGTADQRFIFDFGGYRVQDRFDRRVIPLLGYSSHIKESPEKISTFYKPTDPEAPQINPDKHFNFQRWNGAGYQPEKEAVWLESRKLVEEINQGIPISAVRAKAQAKLDELLELNTKISRPLNTDSVCGIKFFRRIFSLDQNLHP